MNENWEQVGQESRSVETSRGTALLRLEPPAKAVRMTVYASSGDAGAQSVVTAAYSPSGNFIHVQQQGTPALVVGDTARFGIVSTAEARNFYYEVVSRGRVVFTGSTTGDIAFKVTPAMAPNARLLVYQILQNSEVAADAIPFDVKGEYPQTVTASFSKEEARPGDKVQVKVQTEGRAKVGLVVVDRSVFILAENRLNLEQVFAELEALYMQPQAELHEAEWMGGPLVIPGAEETFKDAGLIVLSNKRVPKGKEIESPQMMFDGRAEEAGAADAGGRADDDRGRGHLDHRRGRGAAEELDRGPWPTYSASGSSSPRPGYGTRPSPTRAARPRSTSKRRTPSPPGTCAPWRCRPTRVWASRRARSWCSSPSSCRPICPTRPSAARSSR